MDLGGHGGCCFKATQPSPCKDWGKTWKLLRVADFRYEVWTRTSQTRTRNTNHLTTGCGFKLMACRRFHRLVRDYLSNGQRLKLLQFRTRNRVVLDLFEWITPACDVLWSSHELTCLCTLHLVLAVFQNWPVNRYQEYINLIMSENGHSFVNNGRNLLFGPCLL
jgi:hypothetical protein